MAQLCFYSFTRLQVALILTAIAYYQNNHILFSQDESDYKNIVNLLLTETPDANT